MVQAKQAFTLIELLVAMLIIGILAAVALPQYQRAVEKSKAAEALELLRSVYKASSMYYMANGKWPTKFTQLDIDISWNGTQNWYTLGAFKQGRSNADWSIQLFSSLSSNGGVSVGRISGDYAGVAFLIYNDPADNLPVGRIICRENINRSFLVLNKFQKKSGDYCSKLFHATEIKGQTASSGLSAFVM